MRWPVHRLDASFGSNVRSIGVLAPDSKRKKATATPWLRPSPASRRTQRDSRTKAKHITSILVFAKVVEVDPVTIDRYGRTVTFVRVGDTVVNEELMQQGLAWVFARYCDRPICERWERLEDEATQARRGLWSMSNALPPWEFRRSRR